MTIVILLYHSLFSDSPRTERYAISREAFVNQMDFLSRNSFNTLLLDDLYSFQTTRATNSRQVILTFDDGNYSDYSIAFPVLRERGYVATFFVTTNWVGTNGHVGWHHLREMLRSGMSIQSHCSTHSFLSALPPHTVRWELAHSKTVLESSLPAQVKFLSLPGGFFSTNVLRLAQDVGYRAICTSVPGYASPATRKTDFLVLKRIKITREISVDDLRGILTGNGSYLTKQVIKHRLTSVVKRAIGPRRYYALWSRFFRD